MDDALARATLLQQASKAGLEVLDSAWSTTTRTASATLIRQPDRAAQLRGLGAARRPTATRRRPASSTPACGWRCSRPSARRVLEIRNAGQRALRGRQRRARDARRRGVACWTSPTSDEEPEGAGRATAARRPRRGLRRPADVHPGGETADAGRQCEDCVAEGTRWVALRICLACGKVGCCDSSPEQHATAPLPRDRSTRSSSPPSRARTGAGATCTTSPGDQRWRTTSLQGAGLAAGHPSYVVGDRGDRAVRDRACRCSPRRRAASPRRRTLTPQAYASSTVSSSKRIARPSAVASPGRDLGEDERLRPGQRVRRAGVRGRVAQHHLGDVGDVGPGHRGDPAVAPAGPRITPSSSAKQPAARRGRSCRAGT